MTGDGAVARRAQRGRRRGRLAVHTAILLTCAAWVLPTVGVLVSSFRSANLMRSAGWWSALIHPFQAGQWTLENYASVLTADGMLNAFINSLIVTIPSTVIPITIAAFAAYGFAWMRFPGKNALFAGVVALLVVPLQMALIPVLRMYVSLDLNGTFPGLWMAHTGFGLPLAVYLLYNYISQLPRDIFESAWIDGASHYTAFVRLVVPLSVPAIASFTILQFLWIWNDLLVAMVFLGTNPDVAIVTSRLTAMIGTKGEDWHLLTAGAFVTMIIPLAIFFALQRYFVRGLLSGSVKG
ncbi:MAG: sugar ABC transporter permease [Chloroflexi bacterium RBG_13_66_10]|nr:MAG: sugar ABC transporter permease [Chloroflexi bacterium RBG_13_66_10]